MMLQHDVPKKNYEQTGNKATEIHSHHCLYCDTTFPQFDDLIKHSRENHPYHCYYCKTTFVLFEEVIKHSTENYGSLMLKVKYLQLNPFSGHYGYDVSPAKIKALLPVCSQISLEQNRVITLQHHSRTGSRHPDMTHLFSPVSTYINN